MTLFTIHNLSLIMKSIFIGCSSRGGLKSQSDFFVPEWSFTKSRCTCQLSKIIDFLWLKCYPCKKNEAAQ